MFESLLPLLLLFPSRFWFPVFEPLRELEFELLSEERSVCNALGELSEKRLNGEELLEPLLKVRGLLSELPVLPPDALPREKPWKVEPPFPPLPLRMAPSTGRATVWLPDERVLDELLSDERLLEPLVPLPLPNERVERSELGIWTD